MEMIKEYSDAENDQLIERIASGIARRGMSIPAILFLEMHKPLTFIASQGMIAFSPFMAPFIGFDNLQTASRLLEKRENVEKLICRIEDLTPQRDYKDAARQR